MVLDPTLAVLIVTQAGLLVKMVLDNRNSRAREKEIAARLMLREERHREWALEDRSFLASLGRTHTEELVKQVVTGHDELVKKVDESTEMSKEALEAANGFNGKLTVLAGHAAAALALEAARPTAQDLLPLSLAVALAASSSTPKA